MFQITIGPRDECDAAVVKYNATHIFSIQESMECRNGKGEKIAKDVILTKLPTPHGILKHYHFFFDDLVHPGPVPVKYIGMDERIYSYPPTKEDVAEILETAKSIPDGAHLYLHCFAGISRSSACAFALYCQAFGKGKEGEAIARMHQSAPYGGLSPNELIVQYADDLLDRGGKMIEVVQQYKRKGYEEWLQFQDWLESIK